MFYLKLLLNDWNYPSFSALLYLVEATERLFVILKVGNLSSIAGVHILITQVATIIREITEVVIGYASLGIDIKCNKISMNTIRRRHITFAYPVSTMELFGTLFLPRRKFASDKLYFIESEASVVSLREFVISK